MGVFAVLQTSDKKIQVGDKLRLDASHSFSNAGEITKIEIKPDYSEEFQEVDVSEPVLDWIYETAGDVSAEVRVTVGTDAHTGVCEFEVVTAEEDSLFSSDDDLKQAEPSILKYLPSGKSSFLYAHREAQKLIMADINKATVALRTDRLDPKDVADKSDVHEWSKFLTLALVFESLVNAENDAMAVKAEKYRKISYQYKNLSMIALDLNKDGQISQSEKRTSLGSVKVERS